MDKIKTLPKDEFVSLAIFTLRVNVAEAGVETAKAKLETAEVSLDRAQLIFKQALKEVYEKFDLPDGTRIMENGTIVYPDDIGSAGIPPVPVES